MVSGICAGIQADHPKAQEDLSVPDLLGVCSV